VARHQDPTVSGRQRPLKRRQIALRLSLSERSLAVNDTLSLFPEIADPRVQSHASDGWLFEDGWLTKRVKLEALRGPNV